MKATIGAHGTELASIERTTAVVPHEQKGVATASATEPPTATVVRRRKSVAIRSVPTLSLIAEALTMPSRRYGQLCEILVRT